MYRSENLYFKIDRLIKDEDIFPICVPSYGRPKSKLLQFLIAEPKLKVLLFIRTEEKDIYKEYYQYSHFTIVPLKEVNNIGQTRQKIVKYCTAKKIPEIFMLDDDIYFCDFLLPSITSGGKPAMRPYCTHSKGSYQVKPYFFKMWMMYLKKYGNNKVAISGAGGKADWWNIKNRGSKAVFNSSSTLQCIHLNTKLLKKYNITYKDSEECGIEDYAIQYHCMKAGLLTYTIKDLVYGCPTMGSNNGGCDYSIGVKETMEKRMKLFIDNIIEEEDKYRVTLKTTKSGIPSVRFSWSKWRVTESEG